MAVSLLIVVTLICGCLCLPPHQRRFSDQEFNDVVEHENPKTDNNSSALDELGIEYTRYLQQVIDTLEKDESFKKKLESAAESDIRTAKIAEELEYVNHHVRSKLDELKRTELTRLRELAKQAYGHEHEIHLNPPGHVDHENPETFEIKDLKKLIYQVAQDLEETDKKRKQMFKQYEMEKHFEREQTLQNMTEEEKTKFLHEEEEAKKNEQEAKKRVHHPGSKQQLEEVWEEQDHMNKNDFDPKTFFVMHDVDGNGFLDEDEVKSLFLKELDKLYAQGMPHADLMERAEEMERMREHVFNEVDKNRDRLISWEEFYAMSLKPEFNEDPGWKPIDDQQIYSQDELLAYERQRLAEIEKLKREGKLPPDYHIPTIHNQMNNHAGVNDPNIHYNPAYYHQVPGQPPLHSQDAIHAQQQQYQQHLQQQQLHHPQQQFQHQGQQYQQQQQQYQQQQQQYQQQQQHYQQLPHQQFQHLPQQQFQHPQFEAPQGIPPQVVGVPQPNIDHPQQSVASQNLQPVINSGYHQLHTQPPVVPLPPHVQPQVLPLQPHVQPPVMPQQAQVQPPNVPQKPNLAQQSGPTLPPQPAIVQQSVPGQNVYQQAIPAPQQVNVQQPVAAGQPAYQAQSTSYQAVPQQQAHLGIQVQSLEGKAAPVSTNDQTQKNKV